MEKIYAREVNSPGGYLYHDLETGIDFPVIIKRSLEKLVVFFDRNFNYYPTPIECFNDNSYFLR